MHLIVPSFPHFQCIYNDHICHVIFQHYPAVVPNIREFELTHEKFINAIFPLDF